MWKHQSTQAEVYSVWTKTKPQGFLEVHRQKAREVLHEKEWSWPMFFIVDFMAVIHVDNILMWSLNEEFIFDLGTKLRNRGAELEEEDDVDFLV